MLSQSTDLIASMSAICCIFSCSTYLSTDSQYGQMLGMSASTQQIILNMAMGVNGDKNMSIKPVMWKSCSVFVNIFHVSSSCCKTAVIQSPSIHLVFNFCSHHLLCDNSSLHFISPQIKYAPGENIKKKLPLSFPCSSSASNWFWQAEGEIPEYIFN